MSHGFPDDNAELTHILVVADTARSRRWYEEVLGADVHSAYSSSVVLQFRGAWLLLVEGGDTTDDKPSVTLTAPRDPDTRDNLFTIRVANCQAVYEELRSRGATFLTPPVSHGPETRCFFREPRWPPVRDQRVPPGLINPDANRLLAAGVPRLVVMLDDRGRGNLLGALR